MRKEILGVHFHITNNDIIPNDISTYPQEIVLMIQNAGTFEGDLFKFFESNNYNIICWHATRLTEKEIKDIEENGMNTDDHADFFEQKIKDLPNQINIDIKRELLNHIENIKETQSEGRIYASYGVFDLENDYRGDKIFLKNWGGETIYNYYDNPYKKNQEHLNYIKEELRKVSYPCIVCLRISIQKLLQINPCFFVDFCNQIKNSDLQLFSGNLCTEKNNFEVVNVLKVADCFS